MSRMTEFSSAYGGYRTKQHIFNECAIQKLGEYEDEEEKGLIIHLPVAIEETVWTWEYPTCIDENGDEWVVCDIRGAEIVSKEFNLLMLSGMGDLYFATKEDAEKELENRKKWRVYNG